VNPLFNRFKLGLAVEFLVMLSSIMLVGFISIVYMQYQFQSDQNTENIRDRAVSIGDLLATISVQPLLSHDFVTLNEYVEDTARQTDVTYVAVMDPRGKTLALQMNGHNMTPKDIADLGANGINSREVVAVIRDDDVYSYERVIDFDGNVLGKIEIGLDRKPADVRLTKNVTNLILIIFVIAFVSALGIFLIFRYKVSRPIELVASSAADIADMKFDKTVPVHGNNEISQLALTFNAMRMQLKTAAEARHKSMLKLKDMNVTLEERVDKRTRELQTLNREVAYQAVHDPLTGLPNRLLIVERIRYAIEQAHRSSQTFAVLMVDLDNFKEVNDTLGHPVGDELLRQVADRLSGLLRESDTVGRLGGDEFALILLDVDESSALSVADKIHRAMLEHYVVDGHTLASCGSIGIALYPEHGGDHSTLLRCADIAMYVAKRHNNKVSLYDPETDKHSLQRLSLATDLRVAVDTRELELHYQPIVELIGGQVVGVEALLRWNHPKYGPVSPNEFIPIAESSGLIKPLTDWVLETAASQWLEWQEQDLNLKISVNLSMINLVDPELPEHIAALRDQKQLPVDALKLEITETEIMSNPERVIKVMGHENMQG